MGSIFNTTPRYCGLEIHGRAIRIAEVRKKKQTFEIISIKEFSLEEEDASFQLDKNIKECCLILSMSCRDVLIRQCEIPLKKPKDIFSTLEFHVEPLLPYALDNAVVTGRIIEKRENSSLLTVFATKKNHLENYLEKLQSLGIEPEVVTSTARALAAFSTLLPKTEEPILLIHEGSEEIAFVLAQKGEVLTSRAIEKGKNPDSEVKKILMNLSSSPFKKFEHIYFLGNDSSLMEALRSSGQNEVHPPSSPFVSLSQRELIDFSLSIGNAIAQENVNFRQKAFAYPHRFRRIKKPLAAFSLLALLLSGTLFTFGQIALKQKEQVIAQAYSSLLQREASKIPETLPHNTDAFLRSLKELENSIRAKPETFSLLPFIPKVRETLSWLTSLTELNVSNAGSDSSAIALESIHYQMVQRPDFNNKSAKYKVRVEIELTSKNPQAAKAFQDALKSDNPFIDRKEEIQWNLSKGKYKTSFYLKDKTRYT